jgi:hypothetical protein
MSVTKDEASKKYCPFKFSKATSKEAKEINTEWICEGSHCMMWREKAFPLPSGKHGFCGLSGVPPETRG